MSDDNNATGSSSSSKNETKSDEQKSSTADTTGKEMINIIVKTSKEREHFQLANDSSVKELRQMVSERYNVESHKVCLIFSGKILKDGDTLENHKMKDGYIVHLVIRDVKTSSSSSNTNSSSNASSSSTTASATTTTTATGTTTTTPSSNPIIDSIFNGPFFNNNNNNSGGIPTGNNPYFNLLFGGNNNNNNNNGAGTNNGVGSGAGAGGFMNFNQMNQMMQQLNNPEFMRQMIDSPLMQNLYSNPEIFRSIISSNPQFQQLIERNPELNHVLSNPEVLRQTFDMMRNPAAFQEMMRSHDRAMSNLESLPGGYNALRRMYTELQEPMLNAAQEQFGVNPFASTNSSSTNSSVSSTSSSSTSSTTSSTNTTATTTPSNTENREPLPNPWQRSSNPPPTAGARSNPATGTGAGGLNMFSSNSMQQMLQQMNENPQFIQSMLSSPMMQNMMQSMLSNPQLTAQLAQLATSANNPTATATSTTTTATTSTNNIQTALNNLSPNIDNPLFQRILSNPQAMQAFIQIINGFQQLQRTLNVSASDITELISNNASITTLMSNNATSTTTTTGSNNNETSPATTTTTTTNTGGGTTTPPLISNPNLLAQMMQHMLNVPQQQQQQIQNAESRYQQQLLQLEAMGFTNREANIRALIETFGNVEAAIDRLLSRM